MNVGILVLLKDESVYDCSAVPNVASIAKKLDEYGYETILISIVSGFDRVYKIYSKLAEECDVILVLGKTELFFDVLGSDYTLDRTQNSFEIDNKLCIIAPDCDETFVTQMLIPTLNSRTKTVCISAIFRTFGRTETQLREQLKRHIENCNNVVFKFFTDNQCVDIQICYSNRASESIVNAMIADVTALLKDCTYAYKDVELARQVADALKLCDKQLAIAESFTGGGVASALVAIPGISNRLKESIVCYSNDSKTYRLKVDPTVLRKFGAVSIETVYEMAASLLINKRCDIAVATTGNAGPTSEKPNENGLCYIAVGNVQEINIFPYKFAGNRQTIIRSGVQAALFHLYKQLTQNEFENLFKARDESI